MAMDDMAGYGERRHAIFGTDTWRDVLLVAHSARSRPGPCSATGMKLLSTPAGDVELSIPELCT